MWHPFYYRLFVLFINFFYNLFKIFVFCYLIINAMKKITTICMLSLSGIIAIISLSSSKTASTGVMGQAAQNLGCGSCHGNSASANTVINVSGIPAAGYTPGTTYPVTMTITNPAMTGAGFDLFFTGGAITGNPVGTMLMTAGKEMHHIQRFPMTGAGVYTCNFNWTAPAVGGLVSLTVAANAVNSNDNNQGDEWNKVNFTYSPAPNAVSNVATESVSVYPNPASETFTLDTKNQAPISRVLITGLSGQQVEVPITNNQGKVAVSVEALASGYYQISYYQNGMVHRTSFVKR